MLRMKRTVLATLSVTALLAAGALLLAWTAVRADYAMSADMLQRTRRAAQRVDLQLLQVFLRTPTDLAAPACQLLKQQLAMLRASTPHCRSVQLVGRQANGTLIPIGETRPADLAAGAQTGRRIDKSLRRVFVTGAAETTGHLTDSSGSFVSGVVPLSTEGAGNVTAVLCMELEAQAHDWKGACRASLPAGVSLVLLLTTLCVLLIAWREAERFRPVLWRHNRPW